MLYDHFGYYAPAFLAGIGAKLINVMIIGTLVAAHAFGRTAGGAPERSYAFGTILNISSP